MFTLRVLLFNKNSSLKDHNSFVFKCFFYRIFYYTQELPIHQRSDAVSSMVYEANARIRDPVYGCVGAISSLQQQIDALQSQLALAQAEVVQMRMHQAASFSSVTGNYVEIGSPSSKLTTTHTRSLFAVDMVGDQTNMGGSMWS